MIRIGGVLKLGEKLLLDNPVRNMEVEEYEYLGLSVKCKCEVKKKMC